MTVRDGLGGAGVVPFGGDDAGLGGQAVALADPGGECVAALASA